MNLLKKEKEKPKLFNQTTAIRKQNVLIEVKEKELRTQILSTDVSIVVGVLGFEKVGKSRILNEFDEGLDLMSTNRVSITSTGFGLTLIDTPPIVSKSSRKSAQKEIIEFILRTCHVVLLVTEKVKDKDLIIQIKSSFSKSSDNYTPHVIIILNKCKQIPDFELADIKRFYKKQLQGFDVNITKNTTQPISSRPLFNIPIADQVQASELNFYKLGIIDDPPTFSDQARFQMSCRQLKRDIFALRPLHSTDRWAFSEQEWFRFANSEWQKIMKRS